MTAGTVVFIFFSLGLSCIALQALPGAIGRLLHGRDRQRLNDFYDRRAAAGASVAEISDELRLREALAELRRLASDAVLKAPGDFVHILDRQKAAAVERLATKRPDLARRLGKTTGGLPANHVLYPDAWRAVEALPIEMRDFHLTPDRIAALTIVRPS